MNIYSFHKGVQKLGWQKGKFIDTSLCAFFSKSFITKYLLFKYRIMQLRYDHTCAKPISLSTYQHHAPLPLTRNALYFHPLLRFSSTPADD